MKIDTTGGILRRIADEFDSLEERKEELEEADKEIARLEEQLEERKGE